MYSRKNIIFCYLASLNNLIISIFPKVKTSLNFETLLCKDTYITCFCMINKLFMYCLFGGGDDCLGKMEKKKKGKKKQSGEGL